jgi:hypothetical protein
MKVPNKGELMHLKIQAAMRENIFDDTQLKYLGERAGRHWYLIDGRHEVSSNQFEEFDIVDDGDECESI